MQILKGELFCEIKSMHENQRTFTQQSPFSFMKGIQISISVTEHKVAERYPASGITPQQSI